MYITADDIEKEISLYYLIDNRNGDKKVGLTCTYFVYSFYNVEKDEKIHLKIGEPLSLTCAYFVYSFYNVEKDEKIHLKIGEPLKVKRGCYIMKDIEKVSSGKVKYDLLTGKLIIDPTISRFGPYMNKILGISNGNYIDTLLSKKCFHLKLTNCQPLTTYSMASHVTYCILVTSIKTYHLVISFTLSQRIFNIKSW